MVKLAKKQIEHNLYKIKEKNVKIKVIDGLEMICCPDNIGKDDHIYNEKIFNKIFYFFSIDKMYNQFISSFKDIENHQLKEEQINIKNIQKIILQQKKALKETFVFLVDENIFKNKILDEIFLYFNYNIYCSVKDDEKMAIIEKIFDRESEKDENGINDNVNLKDLVKILSYNEIKYNKGKICLISVDLYQRLFNEPQINYMNIDVNLLKINKELYIYFHKIKKFAKLINKEQIKNSIHDNNIWSVVLLNKEDEEKKNQIIKELNINENIIKKIFLISQQKNTINNIIKGKEKIELKDYSLINRKWLEKYKEHYNYHLILKQLSDISIYKTKFENNNIKMKFNKLPDELKKPENVLPQIQKYLSYEFPNEFDIIKSDLFNLLMKEEVPNDN